MEYRCKYSKEKDEPWESMELTKKENRRLERIGVKVSGVGYTCITMGKTPVYTIDRLIVSILQKGNAEVAKRLEEMGYVKDMRYLSRMEGKKQYMLSFYKPLELCKYLIYRKPTGSLYAVSYFTTAEEIRPYPYISADRLPVMVNPYGGYSSFDEKIDGKNLLYCLIIPKGEEPLSSEDMYPRNSEKFEYGWISPAGDTYLCDYEEHMDCAAVLYENIYRKPCRNAERELEILGWIKVTVPTSIDREFGAEGKRIAYFNAPERTPTKKQLDKLVEENLHRTGCMGYYFED